VDIYWTVSSYPRRFARRRGRAPELGAVTVADYAASLLAVRVDLAPKTRQLYEELQRLWIDAPHELPAAPGRQPRTINLGHMELGALTVATIRDWYAAAIHTTDQQPRSEPRGPSSGLSASAPT
jgi:hypothetical protein